MVSPGWEALILNDYEAVMPLTTKRRFGYDYLFQPPLTQQLGIFSIRILDQDECELFFNSIPAYFSYIDIQLNTVNNHVNVGFTVTLRSNYVLDLTQEYIYLASNYHRNCRRNVQKAVHAGLYVKQVPGPTVFSGFVKNNLEQQLSVSTHNLYAILQEITGKCIQHKCGEILGVYDRTGDLQASGWFVYTESRILFVVCASTRKGKGSQAMYLLVDHAIREKAGSGLLFDFTGSNIPGVAYFNTGFGAIKTTYPAIKKNILPWPVRLFKR